MNIGVKVWPQVGLLILSTAVVLPQERVIHEQKSAINNMIVVSEESGGVRTLRFEKNGARQSVVKLGDPDYLELSYIRSLLVGLAVVENPQRMLMIGLGGGTLPNFLHKHYPAATIDAVDIDPEVVQVAKRFFGFREDAQLRAHVADGRKFIETNKSPYDVIFLDAFSSDSTPYQLCTLEFLQAMRRALTPQGVAVANIWGRGANPLHDSMLRTYREVFDRVYVLSVQSTDNHIVIALPRPDRLNRDTLVARARALSEQKQFPFDFEALVRYGSHGNHPTAARGRILRDKR